MTSGTGKSVGYQCSKDPLPAWQCDHSTNEVSSDGKSCRACTRERDENALTPRPNEARPAWARVGQTVRFPLATIYDVSDTHVGIRFADGETDWRAFSEVEPCSDSAKPGEVSVESILAHRKKAETDGGARIGWDFAASSYVDFLLEKFVLQGPEPPKTEWRVLVNDDGEPYAIDNGTYRRGASPDGTVEPEAGLRRERATVSACRLCGAHPAKADGDCGLHPIASKAQRIEALEEALERIHKGEQPAHKIASDALWKSRGERR